MIAMLNGFKNPDAGMCFAYLITKELIQTFHSTGNSIQLNIGIWRDPCSWFFSGYAENIIAKGEEFLIRQSIHFPSPHREQIQPANDKLRPKMYHFIPNE